jgi:septin family protein
LADLEENGVTATIRLIDAPQVGYSVRKSAGYNALSEYTRDQLFRHIHHELDIDRAITSYRDHRVHVCLYFVTFQELSHQDVQSLSEICKLTNIILVAGKADMMTEEELALQEKRVLQQCEENGIQLFDLETPRVFPIHRRSDLYEKEDGLESVFLKKYLPVLIERSQSQHYENHRSLQSQLTKESGLVSINHATESLSISH